MTKLEAAAKAYREALKARTEAEARCKAAQEEHEAADRALEHAADETEARRIELLAAAE